MKLPEYILEIIQKINDIGYEAYVVGGCVRDENPALVIRIFQDDG